MTKREYADAFDDDVSLKVETVERVSLVGARITVRNYEGSEMVYVLRKDLPRLYKQLLHSYDSEVSEEEALVDDFAEQMKEVLRQNSHKSGWETSDPAYMYAKMGEEFGEIGEKLYRLVWSHSDASRMSYLAAAARECRDVANLAMMLWNICITAIRRIENEND
jgi:hypothetical protein